MLHAATPLFLALVPQIQHAERPPVHPRRLLVKSAVGVLDAEREQAFARIGAKELVHLPQIGWSVVEVAEGALHASRGLLERDARFVEVELDPARRIAYTPNDPMYPSMWNLTQIDADAAWNTQKGAPSVRIAVLDTGIDYTHPDLAANVWTNPGEIPGNSLDDDGNGYADDVHGYDFANFDSDPADDNGHGTACAGIVAAVQDNFQGVTGIAPLCEVVAVKGALSSGFFYASAVVPALVYCADNGFQAISMSYFTDEVVPAEKDAIEYCWRSGVLPIAAAGNDNSSVPYYPGSFEKVLCVGATQSSADDRAYFSNFGSWVDVAAPGLSIPTTTWGGGYTTSFAGTSAACPHVAGLAGLLFSANPSATNADVRAAIEDTALLLNELPQGYWTGYGRIDCDDALARVLGQTSGPVTPRITYVAPCGGDSGSPALVSGPTAGQVTRVGFHGVGLERPRVAQVVNHGNVAPLVAQERTRVVAGFGSIRNGSTVRLEVDGIPRKSIVWERANGLLFAATDACDNTGGVATGGFDELYRNDGDEFTSTDNGFGEVQAQFAVRRITVPAVNDLVVQFSRSYADCNGGTETVELYDWSTWSYPYGTWVVLSTRSITSTATEHLTLTVPGPDDRFLDDTGTLYLRVRTTGAGASGQLNADRMRVIVR
jgi:subtilisin family serine protease